MAWPWRVVWITGASSGIGRSLAIALSREGIAIAASARRRDELDRLASEAPGIVPFPLDVTNLTATRAVAAGIERQLGPIDLAILNAGIGHRMGLADFDPAKAAETMAVNYQGVVNGLGAILPAMRARGSGHVALMSSLAGYRGLPRGIDYCPSKAAAISLAESLRHEMVPAGLSVSVINPGFIDTPMVASATGELPYLMSSEEAARRILAGLARKRFEIAFPWQMRWLARIGQMLPYRLYFFLSGDRGL